MPIIVTHTVTASTSFLDISAALDEHLNLMVGVPPVAWPNHKYEPVEDTLYLRPTNLQGETIPVTDRDQTTGIYQIDIFSPSGEGKNEAVVMSDTVADRFKQNITFTYGGVTVEVKSVSRATISNNENGWSHLMIEVEYYSFTVRR